MKCSFIALTCEDEEEQPLMEARKSTKMDVEAVP